MGEVGYLKYVVKGETTLTVKLNRSVVLDIIKRGKTRDEILNIIDALIKGEFITQTV